MLKKLFMCSVAAVVTVVAVVSSTAPAGAAAKNVVGLITAVGDNSLQIRTKSEQRETVKIDEKTGYIKWITHKPFQQDNSASSRWLDVGRCVDVGLRSDDAGVARIVRINADGAGTFWDPCKGMR